MPKAADMIALEQEVARLRGPAGSKNVTAFSHQVLLILYMTVWSCLVNCVSTWRRSTTKAHPSSCIDIHRRNRHRQQFWSPEGSQSWPWQSVAKSNASSIFPLTARINHDKLHTCHVSMFQSFPNGNCTLCFSVFWHVDFLQLAIVFWGRVQGQGECAQSYIEVWGLKECSSTSVLLMLRQEKLQVLLQDTA